MCKRRILSTTSCGRQSVSLAYFCYNVPLNTIIILCLYPKYVSRYSYTLCIKFKIKFISIFNAFEGLNRNEIRRPNIVFK